MHGGDHANALPFNGYFNGYFNVPSKGSTEVGVGVGASHSDYDEARRFKAAPPKRDDTYTPNEVKMQVLSTNHAIGVRFRLGSDSVRVRFGLGSG